MIYTDLIFVFAFLPLYIVAGLLVREVWAKNAIMLCASLIFLTWSRPWYYILIAVPVFLIYLSGIFIERTKNRLWLLLGAVPAAAYAIFAVLTVGTENTLSSALISLGYILFALRAVSYLRETASEYESEHSLFALAVYLISLENMLISPMICYKDAKKRLLNRRQNLGGMYLGLTEFVKGLALAAVCGNAFERVRLAATEYEAFPWLNALMLVLVTVGEAYVVCAAFLRMSRGISLMNGFAPELHTPAFVPGFRVGGHVGELWASLPEFIRKNLCGRGPLGTALPLAALSLVCGLFLGVGAGACACFGIICIAVILEEMSQKRSRAADAAFTALLLVAAFAALSLRSPAGIAEFFAALDISAYDYDITYALNSELLRSLPWLIAGVVFVSPLPRLISSAVRSKMAENDRFYAAARVAEAAVTSALIAVSVIALA